jgi:hypothetical protein
MITLDTFLTYVLPFVPGCSDPMAIQALRLAATDMCNRTDIVQRVITMDATTGVSAYPIPVPANMNLNRILSVDWQGKRLSPATPDAVASDVAVRGIAIGTASPRTGDPAIYFQALPTDDTFLLYPIPDSTVVGGLTIRASFAPNNAALTVDDVLFDDWVETVAAGALQRLMAMPGQQFTDVHASAINRATFEGGINFARRVKEMGRTAGSQRAAPRRFA